MWQKACYEEESGSFSWSGEETMSDRIGEGKTGIGNILLELFICLFFIIMCTGCNAGEKEELIILDMTTPEKTIELCLEGLKSSDRNVLDKISLVNYVDKLEDINEESKEVQKSYYTDCIAKEWNYKNEKASYETTIKNFLSIYSNADFSKPQRIIGESETIICYKVDAKGQDNHKISEEHLDIWFTMLLAKDGNWYIGRITNKAESDWFGNEKITEESREWAIRFLEKAEDEELLQLFEIISAAQLNGSGNWKRGFENTVQLSYRDLVAFYIKLQSKEKKKQLYDAERDMYRIPILGVDDVACRYLVPDSRSVEEAKRTYNILLQGHKSWGKKEVYDEELGEHVYLVEKPLVQTIQSYSSKNMELIKKEVLSDGTISLEAAYYEDEEKKSFLNHQQLILWIPEKEGEIRYRSYHVIPEGWEEEGNRVIGQFALMKLYSVQVTKRYLEENDWGIYYEENGRIFREMFQEIHITGEYNEGEISEDSVWTEQFSFEFDVPESVLMKLCVGKDGDKEFLAVAMARKEISPAVNGEEVFSYTGNDIPLLETTDYEMHYYQSDNLEVVRETVLKALEIKH